MSTLEQLLRDTLHEAKTPRANQIVLVNRVIDTLSGRLGSADTPVAAQLASWVLGTTNFLPERLAALPAPVVRAMLDGPKPADGAQSFLACYVGHVRSSAALRTRWRAGLAALEVLRVAGIYGLSSRKDAQVPLAGLAGDPRAVAAARETARVCAQAPAAMLALLVLDGSDASLAVLQPRLQATKSSDTELDTLRKLEPLGRGNPQVKALLARVRDGVAERSKASAALDVLAAAGIESVTAFSFQVDVSSLETVKPYPRLPAQPKVRVRLCVDSRETHWFWAVVDAPPTVPALCFGDQGVTVDRKQLPSAGCAAKDLPSWFAELEKTAHLTLDWSGMVFKTSLRGKNRARLESWLRGK